MRYRRIAIMVGAFFLSISGLWIYFQPGVAGGPDIVLPLPILDMAYLPRRQLDIIISLHHEDLHKLNSHLRTITLLPNIAPLNPHVIIYTKDPNSDAETILDQASAENIIHLPNRGREGGTYLWHILNNWEDLAEHTLFIQADIHNFPTFLEKLGAFFVSETGMLDLGFSGISCTLTACIDPWKWEDKERFLPQLYSTLHGSIPPPENAKLTYKGQFVVSARRIRGVGRGVYERMQYLLEDEKSPWSSDKNGRRDAPVFGYTLERAWGLLFGCADGRLVVDCPPYWPGKGGRKGLDSCQCLDQRL
ncbi:hypothetical protein L873DRAFT_1173851 [Choiromyces venosus 120613-1]|uniref:Uncharacterized protein n=1 Tax=Choiromyces venosus 120613-1 TaxID=1336337 RepID=A0A3N4K2M1_9PEZI|nr:hypothetical protein L873DRAFT_1173851 [Choiromyces venosus 120613-1]